MYICYLHPAIFPLQNVHCLLQIIQVKLKIDNFILTVIFFIIYHKLSNKLGLTPATVHTQRQIFLQCRLQDSAANVDCGHGPLAIDCMGKAEGHNSHKEINHWQKEIHSHVKICIGWGKDSEHW